MNNKVKIFTNIAPHYREELWLTMVQNKDIDYHFYFGVNKNNGIETIDLTTANWSEYSDRIHVNLKNIRLFNRLIFQIGVISKVVMGNCSAIIFLGDANIISTWVGATIARIRNIPIVFWGHGVYGAEKGIKKYLRYLFLKIPNVNLVYGHWAKNIMVENGFDVNKTKVIYNSVDYYRIVSLRLKVPNDNYFVEEGIFSNNNPVLLFIGRLTASKKLNLLIDSYLDLEKKDKKVNLLIIGNGAEKSNLQERVKNLKNICFYGACYEEEKLCSLISNADLCVSPGNVGLTAIHSLSYGTPVCTHNNFEIQMPEAEAIQEGITGCFYDWEKKNITETIEYWLDNAPDRAVTRENCYKVVDTLYNPKNQVRILTLTIAELTSS